MVVRKVDVEEVVVTARVGDFLHVVEILDDGDGAFEPEVEARFESAFAGPGEEAAGGLGRRGEAGEVGLHAEGAELEAEVERGLGGPGPLPVAEQVKDAHEGADYNS
jgi:hypothetical protein